MYNIIVYFILLFCFACNQVCVPCARRDQKRALNTLGPALPTVVSGHVDAGSQSLVLLTAKPSLQPLSLIIHFVKNYLIIQCLITIVVIDPF
ncbi:hypothetical protein ACRRTK_024774 [Alexandromys fortis]